MTAEQKQYDNFRARVLNLYGKEPETMSEVAEAIILLANDNVKSIDREKQDLKLIGFKWELTYSNQVSNSHNCPILGITNWRHSDHPERPTSYPGFFGRLWVRYNQEPKSFGSRPIDKTCLHTGTGGIGHYNGCPWKDAATKEIKVIPFSWDVKLFINDWPKIEEQIVMLKLVSDTETFRRHVYIWEDPETLATDLKVHIGQK